MKPRDGVAEDSFQIIIEKVSIVNTMMRARRAGVRIEGRKGRTNGGVVANG